METLVRSSGFSTRFSSVEIRDPVDVTIEKQVGASGDSETSAVSEFETWGRNQVGAERNQAVRNRQFPENCISVGHSQYD